MTVYVIFLLLDLRVVIVMDGPTVCLSLAELRGHRTLYLTLYH